MNSSFPLLAQIDSPAALRRLPESSLSAVAAELRGYLIETIGKSGGHFAANLGTVELTIALHYIFETPEDRLVWDVGHQTYPHKILTGRREALSTIRKLHGLAPFPQRAESPFDSFGVGHSSTSISAALGMALAFRQQQKDNQCVAVIG
ncbi:MAG TPA: 1-deoxy-D-xylulose-5-phosphate synthase, partial [Gammaproteobacteria bacterium]|nr:1-deoxy-D-xylulose-5-phosphate synthase [Gammaproteobacteria bacterium]